ncbi:MAG: efflux RND transporter periplasmic adaptor subunit [Thermoanaerobaculales bacterium]|jgi:RND family efflux transporter MFP subunit|nr:efflux RND transporter periplasmic adaptor subunit [Thermoanaerobaculales bacterium]
MTTTRLITIIVTLAAAMTLIWACGSKFADDTADEDIVRPAKIVTVGASSASARTYPGRVQAAQRVQLSFRVGGPVVDISVSKGQQVRAGQVLARIDPRDYRVQVANLEAQLAAAKAQQLQATETYQRVRGLYEHDNASKADFDNARAGLDVSTAQVEATEQALRAARLSLADTELTAPYDGTVADRLVEEHQTVTAGQPIVQFQGAGGLEVLIHVPEREVGELTRTAPAGIEVRFDALADSKPLPARVKEFATETDRQTQTFPVTLELEGEPSSVLMPGMTASVEWMTGDLHDQSGTVVVPLGAVASKSNGTTHVWTVDPETMTLSRAEVTTGALTDAGIEILSGLEQGDRIIAAGVDFATDGQQVRPLETDKD